MIGSKPVALDTNIAVQLLNDAPHVISWLGAFGTLVLPVTALGELNFGAHNSTRAVVVRFMPRLAALERIAPAC